MYLSSGDGLFLMENGPYDALEAARSGQGAVVPVVAPRSRRQEVAHGHGGNLTGHLLV